MEKLQTWVCKSCGREVSAIAWDLACTLHDFERCNSDSQRKMDYASIELPPLEYGA